MLRTILFFIYSFPWLRALACIFAWINLSNAEGVKATAIEYGNNELIALAAVSAHNPLAHIRKNIDICENSQCLTRESDMYISLVVTSNGPSTDVSAPSTLYLTMFNSVQETAIAQSVQMIDEIYELHSSKQISDGVFEAKYLALRTDGKCLQPIIRATIDARDLIVAVGAAKEINHLNDFNYIGGLEIKTSQLSCTD